MPNLLKYDVIYILDPMATAEEMAAVSAKVEQVLNDAKGTVLKKDEWGKRRLAYPVKKHREGLYVFYHVSIFPESVSEITRNLRLMEKVIKYSVVKDTISHLKPKPKPIRTPRPPSAEGAGHRSGGPRAPAPPLSAPAASAPGSSSNASSTEPIKP
jgi:small subunit ribosomal protein S6